MVNDERSNNFFQLQAFFGMPERLFFLPVDFQELETELFSNFATRCLFVLLRFPLRRFCIAIKEKPIKRFWARLRKMIYTDNEFLEKDWNTWGKETVCAFIVQNLRVLQSFGDSKI